jgi:hypothetical protein
MFSNIFKRNFVTNSIIKLNNNNKSIIKLNNNNKSIINFNVYNKSIIDDIKKIGPYTYEAQWFFNMLNNPDSCDIIDGHSGLSHGYTNLITNVIKKKGYDDWKTKHVHLSFDEMNDLFFLKGLSQLGNILITHSFNSELLENFNAMRKKDNYTITKKTIDEIVILGRSIKL